MRLNRVLQNKLNRVSLLATISMAMAAATFTISCGEDGSNGKEGADCIVTGSGVPYQIFCGGQPVGTLNNGPQGPTGDPGTPGIPGAQGRSCIVNQNGVSWDVVCGTEVMGTLSGCRVVQNSVDNLGDFTINCGETVVNMCNNEVLEEGKYCYGNGGGYYSQQDILECGPDKTPYISAKQYCGFETAAAVTAGTPKPLPYCGVNKGPNDVWVNAGAGHYYPNQAEPVVDAYGDTIRWVLTVGSGCQARTKPDGTNNPVGIRCRDNSVKTVTINNVSTVVQEPDSVGLRSWQNEYCEVNRRTNENGANYVVGSTQPIATGKTIDQHYANQPLNNKCDSILNKDGWKGEYCGFNTTGMAKLNDACSNGARPNESAVTRAYCAKGHAKAKLSELSSAYCTPVYTVYLDGAHNLQKTPVGVEVPLNRIVGKPNTLLTSDDVADEYCGFTLVDWNKTRKSLTKITTPTQSKPDTVYTSVRKSKCSDGTVLDPEGVLPGIAQSDPDYVDSTYIQRIVAYLRSEKDGTVPFPAFKNQYCQASLSGTTVTTTAVPVTAPKSLTEAYAVYCMKNPLNIIATGDYAGMLAYSADPQTGSNANQRRLNINTWAGEYCAYPTAAAFYAPATLSSSSVADLDPVITNAAGTALRFVNGDIYAGTPVAPVSGHAADANGPAKYRTCDILTAVTSAGATFNAPNAVGNVDALGYWPNQYCQYKKVGGFDKVVGLELNIGFSAGDIADSIEAYKGTATSPSGNRLVSDKGTGERALFKKYCPIGDTATGTIASGRLSLDSNASFADGAAKYAFNKRYIKAYQGLLGSVSGDVVTISTLNAGAVTYNAGQNSWTAVTNNAGWRNQYCGIEKTNFGPTTDTRLRKFSVINTGYCTQTDGSDNISGRQPNDYTTYTLDSYPEEYCQFVLQSSTINARVASLYDDGATRLPWDRFDSLAVRFCVTDTAGYGAADNKAAWYKGKGIANNQRMNQNAWSREYCAITTYPGGTVTKAAFSKIGSLTTAAGVCDDGGFPNGAGIQRTETFQNEYCQASEDGKTARVGGVDAYCDVPGYPANPDAWRAATIGSAYRVNEGTWKGQYCFADFKIAVCLGGQVPATTSSGTIVNSTSTPRCRMPGETI